MDLDGYDFTKIMESFLQRIPNDSEKRLQKLEAILNGKDLKPMEFDENDENDVAKPADFFESNCHSRVLSCQADTITAEQIKLLAKKPTIETMPSVCAPVKAVPNISSKNTMTNFLQGFSKCAKNQSSADSELDLQPVVSPRPTKGNISTDNIGKNIKSSKESKDISTPPISFRTAREELIIQNMKNGRSSNSATYNSTNGLQKTAAINTTQQPMFNYGATKKTLGARRNVRSNFVPPIATEAEKQTDDNSSTSSSQPDDERLVNIDPKMIELISNEIMHSYKLVDWDDIAGLEYPKEIIREAVIYPLLRPDFFTGLRRPPRGILLFGPPGTGKTLIGKCIASKSKATFFSISASSLTSKYVGDSEKMVRALFAVAAVQQPSVIFIDEIDSLLSQRSETEHEATRRLKTEFLVQFDGVASTTNDRVLIVGATNRPQELDDAARRRFVKRLYIPLPEMAARLKILRNLLETVNNSLDENDLKVIAEKADGYSGADMESLCCEASMAPIRCIPESEIPYVSADKVRPVTISDFEIAIEKVRPSVSQNDLAQYVTWNTIYGATR